MNYIELKRDVLAGKVTADEAYLTQLEMLNAKLDPRLIEERSQGGTSLSYLATHAGYQIMGVIFGAGNWSFHTNELRETLREEREKNGKAQYVFGSSARCTLEVTFINGVTSQISDVGNGNGVDYQGFHTTSESAEKEAISDAFKRCAKSLGNSLALALYNKSRTMVGYSKHTVMIEPVDMTVIRPLAVETEATKAITKEYLESLSKTKLGELDQTQMEELYQKLVD